MVWWMQCWSCRLSKRCTFPLILQSHDREVLWRFDLMHYFNNKYFGKLCWITLSIKIYLVTSNGEVSTVYKFLRNGSPWSKGIFEKGQFLTQMFQWFKPKAFYYASESKLVCATRFFFAMHNSLATLVTSLFQIFTDLLFYAYICWDTPS